MNEKNNAVAQHTPGPWWVFANDAGVGVTTGVADVAHCHGFDSRCGAAEVEANARLIAAAPELLKALEMVVSEADSYTARTGKPVYNWLDAARAAIAKARGAQ